MYWLCGGSSLLGEAVPSCLTTEPELMLVLAVAKYSTRSAVTIRQRLVSVTATSFCTSGLTYTTYMLSAHTQMHISSGILLCRITIVSIAIDALLGAGALARGWSSYLAVLCDQPSDKWAPIN